MAASKKTMASHRTVLGIGLNATYRVAKAAYRKALLAAHPDKGGTTERMAEVSLLHSIWNVVKEANELIPTGERGLGGLHREELHL